MTIMSGFTRRDVVAGVAAAGCAGWTFGAFAQGRNARDVLSHVAPELRPAAERILKSADGQPPFTMDGLTAVRGGSTDRPAVPRFARRWSVPGGSAAPDLPVYVVNARRGARRPAILHLHGGGFMLGSALDRLPRLHRIAMALDCVVVTIEYRLAPETPFPGALEDGYAALRWLHSRALDFGVDPTRIAVLGESAGGGLAALLALLARDRGGPPLAFQALIYPMLDDRTGTTVHPPSPRGALAWTADINSVGWRAFLGRPPGGPDVPVRAIPARRADLGGLPPTFIGVGSIDLLVDEAVKYGRRLLDADVPTELVVVPGAFHAFDVVAPTSSLARSFNALQLDAFRRAFQSTRSVDGQGHL